MEKIILLRNEKTGAWKYTKMNPAEFKKNSWKGYDYYGQHKSVANAMLHATNIVNDDIRKANEEKRQHLPMVYSPQLTTMHDSMEMCPMSDE